MNRSAGNIPGKLGWKSRDCVYLTLLATLCAGIILPVAGQVLESDARPNAWATKLELPGLPNLHKVDDGLYRGAQPTAEGIRELEKLGVKTIVNLRSAHSDKEIIGDSKIAYESITLNTWNVKQADVVRFLKIATDKNCRPVFVHCQHGSDRTGTMCAAYRVVVQNWAKEQAIEEMTKGGFGFHSIWKNLPELIENLNVEKIRAELRPPQLP